MSTRGKEKLAAARKKLKKFQSRQEQKSAAHVPDMNALLEGMDVAPSLAPPAPSLTLNSLSLTTPTDIPIPVSNGYVTSGGWSLVKRPLSPPATDSDPPHRDIQAQTIDILVTEKSSLKSEVDSLHIDLRNKKREVEDLSNHLQVTRDQLEQNERLTLSLSEKKTHLVTVLEEVTRARGEVEQSLEEMRMALDETRLVNTELVSKVTSQAAELSSLQLTNSDLRSRLTMSELLTQQLSSVGGESGDLGDQVGELRSEVGRLESVVRGVSGERDQALGDLDALREAMLQQRQESAERLAGLHLRLAESEAERMNLSEQLAELSLRQNELTQQASSEHAQLQQSTKVAMETLQKENEQLQSQLQLQSSERERLSQSVSQLQSQLEEAERETERLRESSVDSRALMDTISQDKEALSRTVTQNREMKRQLEELQDGFVRLSQQNMELASDLETERFRVNQLESQAGEEGRGEVAGEGETRVCLEVGTQTEVEGGQEEGEMEENQLLVEQLQELVRERDTLREEIALLNSQLLDQSTVANERGSPGDAEAANQTMDLLSALQVNFNALQDRYVVVMSEKVELLELVEQRELTIGQLSGETETIGEYIMLYQAQREALRAKFKEKDNFIRQLISEKEAAQTQLTEVQRLLKQLVTERDHRPSGPTPSQSPPPPSSPSSLPLHLQPHTSHHHQAPPPPRPSADTVDQIFQLLSVMGEPGEGVTSDVVPCACCTGDVIAV